MLPKPLRRRRIVLLSVSALALVGLVAAVFLHLRDSHDPQVSALRPEARQDDGPVVARALATLPDHPERFVSSAAGELVGGQSRQAVPTGTSLRAAPDTWAPDGRGGGTITASLRAPEGQERQLLVVVDKEQGAWKVVATFPVLDQGSEP